MKYVIDEKDLEKLSYNIMEFINGLKPITILAEGKLKKGQDDDFWRTHVYIYSVNDERKDSDTNHTVEVYSWTSKIIDGYTDKKVRIYIEVI